MLHFIFVWIVYRIDRPIHQRIHPSIQLSIYPSIRPSIYACQPFSVFMSVFSVCLALSSIFICLSTCLSVSIYFFPPNTIHCFSHYVFVFIQLILFRFYMIITNYFRHINNCHHDNLRVRKCQVSSDYHDNAMTS